MNFPHGQPHRFVLLSVFAAKIRRGLGDAQCTQRPATTLIMVMSAWGFIYTWQCLKIGKVSGLLIFLVVGFSIPSVLFPSWGKICMWTFEISWQLKLGLLDKLFRHYAISASFCDTSVTSFSSDSSRNLKSHIMEIYVLSSSQKTFTSRTSQPRSLRYFVTNFSTRLIRHS
jgi:hypothetical protein